MQVRLQPSWGSVLTFRSRLISINLPKRFDRSGCVVSGRSDRKEKRRSFIGFRFRPNPPAMFANNALHDCQAYPRAFKIPRLVQPLKNSEELAYVLHLEAR